MKEFIESAYELYKKVIIFQQPSTLFRFTSLYEMLLSIF